MSEDRLVSIIVPVYNGERFVRESLDSLLAQTYPHIELIVIDDASTDGTPSVLEAYATRAHVHRQSTNQGIYATANDGIALAAGEYVAIYHADDVYEPTIVEREVDYLTQHPDVGAAFCMDTFIDATGRRFGQLDLPPEVRGEHPLSYADVLNALLMHKNTFLRCPGAMVRASVYRDVGGYDQTTFRNTADLDMWVRIARHNDIGILEEHLYRYRRGIASSSERYHHLRTDPLRYFAIIDRELAEGGRALATRSSLRAYEAHRAEDLLLVAVSRYILGQIPETRESLRLVRARAIASSRRVQRIRLSVLLGLMHTLVRLPRIGYVADLFRRHWHGAQGGVPER